MKKVLFTLLIALLPLLASAQRVTIGKLNYNLSSSDKTAMVVQYDSYETKYEGDIIIPPSVEYGGTTYRVTAIGDNAFWDCGMLTAVTIPEGVKRIGEMAFNACGQITTLTLPASVTSIAPYAFTFMQGLTSITVDSGNKVFDSRNQCNAIIETASGILRFGCNNTVIPTGVTALADNCFEGCVQLTKLDIPNGVKSIGRGAFMTCVNLTSVTIPPSVNSIGGYAFYECKKLPSLTIPEGVTRIEEYICAYCESMKWVIIPSTVTILEDGPFYKELTDVYCYAVNPPKSVWGEGSFISIMPFNDENVMPATLHVPQASLGAYSSSDTGWRYFKNIVALTAEELAIHGPSSTVSQPSAWYTLDGRQLPQAPAIKGIYVRRGADGSSRKVLVSKIRM